MQTVQPEYTLSELQLLRDFVSESHMSRACADVAHLCGSSMLSGGRYVQSATS